MIVYKITAFIAKINGCSFAMDCILMSMKQYIRIKSTEKLGTCRNMGGNAVSVCNAPTFTAAKPLLQPRLNLKAS